MKFIDLRSDTVTKPDKPMLEAIMASQVGDDVYGEDPSVNKLQQKCAELTGKEDALFVPTGVMANQLSIKAHTIDGDEVIVEAESHILNYETAAPAVISRVQLLPVKGNNGVLYAKDIAQYVRSKEYYFPVTRLICLENTHNRAGGVILPIDSIKDVSEFAKKNVIKMHLDGARVFNAVVETGISLKEYAGYFDSISFCFSKGLGAPVGSIICGSKEFINIARKWRKIIGGGMRQAGILASAGLYALENNVERLKTDNERAKSFAKELQASGNYELPCEVQTNIVIFKSKKHTKEDFIAMMKEKGILVSSGSYDWLRIIFHKDVSEEDFATAKKVFLN